MGVEGMDGVRNGMDGMDGMDEGRGQESCLVVTLSLFTAIIHCHPA